MHRSRPTALARSAWRRWFLDRKAEFWLGQLRATWSLSELRARVVGVRAETATTKTFTLTTPRAWPGHVAGQYVPVEVEIEGVRVRRCYSISSGGSQPGRQTIEITVKWVPGGRVSSWMHEHLAVGAVVRLGAPAGDFTVGAPTKLLLVGAGSGITPIAAIRGIASASLPWALRKASFASRFATRTSASLRPARSGRCACAATW
jgi:ferredoxin-NADP reductase